MVLGVALFVMWTSSVKGKVLVREEPACKELVQIEIDMVELTSGLLVKLVSASDQSGGAGRAAYRLLRGLRSLDVNAELLVQEKISNDDNVKASDSCAGQVLGKVLPYLDPLPKLVYPHRHRGAWSCGTFVNPYVPSKRMHAADIVHLHWITGGFIPVKNIPRIEPPIIWTLHDSWPFTGGCHVPFECREYEKQCGDCPLLKSGRKEDLSRKIWRQKSRAWERINLTLVAPSRWMASCASRSGLFRNSRIEIIPNGLDAHQFAPVDKVTARHSLGLPREMKQILFSAMGGQLNWNKGSDLLSEALRSLPSHITDKNQICLLLVGNDVAPSKDFYPVPTINLGRLSDELKIRSLYSAADLTVVPSRSENLPYVVMESMSCGTPVVSFSVGGIPDLIDHRLDGFLAKPNCAKSLCEGIQWALSGVSHDGQIGLRARKKIVSNYDHGTIAKRHLDLYEKTLTESND